VAYGRSSKLLLASEVQDFQNNGFALACVIESSTSDAWGTETDDDYGRGQRFGIDALTYMSQTGVPDGVPVACPADAHAAPGQLDDVVRFAQGFASVVAPHRPAGMYGFSEVMNATRDQPGLSWWWQCGSQPEKTGTTWVNLWQRNDGTVTISGIPCDINEEYHPLPHGGNDMELSDVFTTRYDRPLRVDDFFAWLDYRVTEIHNRITGAVPSKVDPNAKLEPLAFLPFIDYYATSSAKGVAGAQAAIEALSKAIADGVNDVDQAELVAAVTNAIKEAVVKVDVTVHGEAQA